MFYDRIEHVRDTLAKRCEECSPRVTETPDEPEKEAAFKEAVELIDTYFPPEDE